jgi:mRNA-degrading endonuclease toxin of MazEF toxin-antitoxin module
VSTLCQGRIVRVEVSDPQGRNPKVRPAVIITPTEAIRPDGVVELVAITGTQDPALADVQVALPWHAQGQTKTRLTKPCLAVCTWTFASPVTSIQSQGGIVPDRQLLQILSKIRPKTDPPPETPTSTT